MYPLATHAVYKLCICYLYSFIYMAFTTYMWQATTPICKLGDLQGMPTKL